MDIASRITSLRTKKGYSVNKLSNLAGLSQGFVRQIELNEKKPTVESLSLLCDALGISLAEFFTEETPEDQSILLNKLNNLTSSLDNSQLKTLIEVAKHMHS